MVDEKYVDDATELPLFSVSGSLESGDGTYVLGDNFDDTWGTNFDACWNASAVAGKTNPIANTSSSKTASRDFVFIASLQIELIRKLLGAGFYEFGVVGRTPIESEGIAIWRLFHAVGHSTTGASKSFASPLPTEAVKKIFSKWLGRFGPDPERHWASRVVISEYLNARRTSTSLVCVSCCKDWLYSSTKTIFSLGT